MTKLLERGMSRLQSLPASKQDAIAATILAEIEDDLRWNPPNAGVGRIPKQFLCSMS
jgi:hypothetical protein